MRDPYRVAVWGPGGIGGACVREIAALPELDLVGALVYGKSNEGRDVGEIVGMQRIGVAATRDRNEIFALKPDCVLYTARDHGDFRSDSDIIELLERGMNVITSLPYQNTLVRGEALVRRLQQACAAGGSTLFAAGINPGFMFERLALTATGICNDIQYIKLEEYIRAGNEPRETLEVFGFGLPLEEAKKSQVAVRIADNYERQFLYFAGATVGLPIDHVERSTEMRVTPVDIVTPTQVIKANTVAWVSHKWVASSNARNIFIFQTYWHLSVAMRPESVPCDDFYVLTIEGRPSVRMNIELKASIEKDTRMCPGDPTVPNFRAAAVALVQSIPSVVVAPPGIRQIAPPANSYWKADMRG